MATVDEYGDYVCHVTNEIGTSTFVFEVKEEGKYKSKHKKPYPKRYSS